MRGTGKRRTAYETTHNGKRHLPHFRLRPDGPQGCPAHGMLAPATGCHPGRRMVLLGGGGLHHGMGRLPARGSRPALRHVHSPQGGGGRYGAGNTLYRGDNPYQIRRPAEYPAHPARNDEKEVRLLRQLRFFRLLRLLHRRQKLGNAETLLQAVGQLHRNYGRLRKTLHHQQPVTRAIRYYSDSAPGE